MNKGKKVRVQAKLASPLKDTLADALERRKTEKLM